MWDGPRRPRARAGWGRSAVVGGTFDPVSGGPDGDSVEPGSARVEEDAVEAVIRGVVGVLIIAHGLVHTLYFASSKDADWPFRLDRSWLLPEQVRRPLGTTVIALTVLAFVAVGLAIWGAPGFAPRWPALTIWAAALSLVMLVAFWDRQLIWGVAIDLGLLLLAVWRPDWTDHLG